MKLGPVKFPFDDAWSAVGFALAVVAVIAIVRRIPLPAAAAPFKP